MIPTIDQIVDREQVSFPLARAIRNNCEVLLKAFGDRIYLMTPDEATDELIMLDGEPREFIQKAVRILQEVRE